MKTGDVVLGLLGSTCVKRTVSMGILLTRRTRTGDLGNMGRVEYVARVAERIYGDGSAVGRDNCEYPRLVALLGRSR